MIDFNKKRILVVVAHPDDEILGLGASMHKIIKKYQAKVRVLILGEGLTSRSEQRDTVKWKDELALHKSNIKSASKVIGYDQVEAKDFPDNRFDSVPLLDIIKVIEQEKNKFNPSIIFTHHGGDVNIDHQRTFEAVITACRPMEHETVKSIFTFETMSGTEWRASTDPKHFVPNYFISVDEGDVNAKIMAMESYEFEKRAFPHPRSPEALTNRAKMWGVTVGKEFVEAFSLVRNVLD